MNHRHEHGVTLVETAIVLPMLILLALGIAEIGFGLISQMTAAQAVREGARTAANGSTAASTELATIKAIEQAMCAIKTGELISVEIFKSDDEGNPISPSLLNRYEVSGPLQCSNTPATALVCVNGCPWPPSARSNHLGSLDKIGVRVYYTHKWLLDAVFTDNPTWSDVSVMQIEPEVQ